MLVSIGLLAHDEASGIEATIKSLAAQSVFASSPGAGAPVSLQVVVVANGCTDDTAAVSRAALERWLPPTDAVEWTVSELAIGDKSTAWNHFVHAVSHPGADYLVLLDADIEFGNPHTIRHCLQVLDEDPWPQVCVDLPVKDIARKAHPNLWERLSLRQSASGAEEVGISGQFYCARTETLRAIWLPPGLPVEDGYVYCMVITDGFRAAVDKSKVVRAPGADHYYEALTRPRDLIRHEARITVGTALNEFFLWDFLQHRTPPDGPPASVYVREQMERDPTWYRTMMGRAVAAQGWWVLPPGMLWRRFGRLRSGRGWASPRRWLVALVGFAIDVPVMVTANRALRRGRGISYW